MRVEPMAGDRSPHTNTPTMIHTTSRRAFIAGSAAVALTTAAGSPVGALDLRSLNRGERAQRPVPPTVELATGWVRTLYDVVMAEGLTPPAAARFYHYASLAMYETAVTQFRGYRSLARQLNRLDRTPGPNGPIDVTVAVCEALALLTPELLPTAGDTARATIETYRDTVITNHTVPSARVLQRSTQHGRRVAKHLLRWISKDGYTEAISLGYEPPTGPEMWRSTPPNFGTAIEPHWGMIRPAILETADEVRPIDPVPFSTEPGSPFHEQATATYRQSQVNTEEQVAIARFWTDNPRLSGLPSGHWFLLLADLAEADLELDFAATIEGFVRLGVALHDSFLNCWTWKYRYNLIRPVSYIHDHVDPGWVTLVNTPQFPEYTSGHSVASGAADVVLTTLFGSFPFTDSTGEPRGLAARSFSCYTHAANEAAESRLYGGIHYPMAIENGIVQGRQIGQLVDQRLQTSGRRRPR